MNNSEVARLREQLALEEQASRLGLYGSAIVANHNSITARLQLGAERITRLMQEGKMHEAAHLMEQPDWGADMQKTTTETQEHQAK